MSLFLTTHNARLRLSRGLLLGLAVALLMSVLLNGNFFSTTRTNLQDSLYSPGKTEGITAIVAIDDASLAALGRSTVFWDRRAHADMVEILTEASAKVIAFDIIFAEPTEQDDELAAAIEAASKGAPGERLPIGVVQAMSASGTLNFRGPSAQYVYPNPAFADLGVLGHVNIAPDNDGVVRSYPLAIYDANGDYVPALGLAAQLAYLRFPRNQVVYTDQEVQFAGRTVPTLSNRKMLVYYFGEPTSEPQDTAGQTFPVYSYIDLLCTYRPDAEYYLPGFNCADRPDAVDVPLEQLTDKIVLLGVLGATADPDQYPVAISKNVQMYGVEIHANVIETLHQSHPEVGRVLPLVEQPLSEKIMIIFGLALFSGIVLPFLRWYVAMPVVILLYAVYFVWAVFVFQSDGKIAELLFPPLTLAVMLFGVLLITYVFEERRRNQINDLFQRYVSPDIARKIVEIADRGDLNLAGEEREITVMFADIRGFTTLSEGLTPREVVDLLNTFLEKMNEVVLANGGAINKYIGDNLMAFWNAPYPQDDHAWKAVQAGLGLLKVVDELNATGQFKSKVQFGIGVNTGNTVVGNIGSKQRLEYTPIGDTVNIASRLSGKAAGGSMLVGEGTFAVIQGRGLAPVGQDSLMLKGKTVPVIAYEFRADGKKPEKE